MHPCSLAITHTPLLTLKSIYALACWGCTNRPLPHGLSKAIPCLAISPISSHLSYDSVHVLWPGAAQLCGGRQHLCASPVTRVGAVTESIHRAQTRCTSTVGSKINAHAQWLRKGSRSLGYAWIHNSSTYWRTNHQTATLACGTLPVPSQPGQVAELWRIPNIAPAFDKGEVSSYTCGSCTKKSHKYNLCR